MVKVYFEKNNHAEVVANFDSEQLYLICLPALEAEAKKQNKILTESISDIPLSVSKIKESWQ